MSQKTPQPAFLGGQRGKLSTSFQRSERQKMAIKKPVPKELVIRDLGYLCITATTDDARQWIEQEAPTFGQLFPPGIAPHYNFFIFDTYDRNEVIAYLNSYNDEATE